MHYGQAGTGGMAVLMAGVRRGVVAMRTIVVKRRRRYARLDVHGAQTKNSARDIILLEISRRAFWPTQTRVDESEMKEGWNTGETRTGSNLRLLNIKPNMAASAIWRKGRVGSALSSASSS
jgi:hypothetical protein